MSKRHCLPNKIVLFGLFFGIGATCRGVTHSETSPSLTAVGEPSPLPRATLGLDLTRPRLLHPLGVDACPASTRGRYALLVTGGDPSRREARLLQAGVAGGELAAAGG